MAFLQKIKEKAVALINIIFEFVKEKAPVVRDWVLAFLKNTFEITSSKKSKITGIAFLSVTLIWVVLSVNTFLAMETSSKWVLLAFALACPFLIGLNIAFTIRIKNNLINQIWHFVALLLMPILIMSMTECLNNIFIYDMTYLGFLGNYLVRLHIW